MENADTETTAESVAREFAERIPNHARRFLGEARAWMRDNPREAALLSAAGGFVVGYAGISRIYRGAKMLRSMPFASRILFGAIAKGFLAKDLRAPEEAVH